MAAVAAASLLVGVLVAAPERGDAAAKADPSNTGTPTISGTPQENSKLTASNGSWSGDPTSYSYAWSRCNKNGNSCSTISDATDNTYTLQSADVDHTLRVTVTAKNADGKGEATSAPTAVVSSDAAPKSTAAPAITGSLQVGSTLTVSKGGWSGNPTKFDYAWQRCDTNGNSCATISGSTAAKYVLKQVDVGNTLRAIVRATNSGGSTSATTVPTGLVQGTPPKVVNGCPAGNGPVQVADLSAPARLSIGQQSISPGLVRPSATTIQLRFRVTACDGRPVQGAQVFAVAIPYNQFTGTHGTTGSDGTVTLVQTQQRGFPASRRQQLLAVLVRANKPGESILGGVSSRRLVTFHVSLR